MSGIYTVEEIREWVTQHFQRCDEDPVDYGIPHKLAQNDAITEACREFADWDGYGALLATCQTFGIAQPSREQVNAVLAAYATTVGYFKDLIIGSNYKGRSGVLPS